MAQRRLARRKGRLLRRLLDAPHLVETIRALPAQALGLVVAEVGVEDSAEIVALATTEQLTHLFDEDVFDDERVDPERFALWLEVLLEAGDAFTADRVIDLPEDLVYAAVNDYVRVFDLDALAMEIEEREDLTSANDLLEAARTEELLGRLLVARRADGWDAMWSTMVAVAERHGDYAERLLTRLCDATMDRVAEDGLYEVLSSEEMLAEEAAADREERRAKIGYVSPSDARAFLKLAREGAADPDTRDAITAAWFRRLAPEPTPAPSQGLDLELVLERVGLSELARPALGPSHGGSEPVARFRAAMRELAARAPEKHDARLEELSFLANVLSASANLGERPRRSVEAVEEALTVCAAALVGRSRGPDADVDVLAERPLDLLFREGLRDAPPR
jgi:hypothetical protein